MDCVLRGKDDRERGERERERGDIERKRDATEREIEREIEWLDGRWAAREMNFFSFFSLLSSTHNQRINKGK